jgi:hypothetical protein
MIAGIIASVLAAAAPPAGITYVGSKNTTLSLTSGDWVVSLTDLNGVSGANPVEGDLIIISYSTENTGAIDVAGWTKIVDAIPSGTGRRAHTGVFYKFMGATPDTTATVTAGFRVNALVAQVWRGVNQTTPFDVTSTVTNIRGNSTVDFTPITPITTGALVLVHAHLVAQQGDTDGFTNPGGALENYTGTATQINNIYSLRAMCGSYAWTSGAFDPPNLAAITVSNSGTTYVSYIAVTMALRPA